MNPFNLGDPFTYANVMKNQGNQDFRNGKYSVAIKKYEEAISAISFLCQTQGVSYHREMAVLLCNRSNAFYNLNKWGEAYYSAQESLQWDPTYVKGYYRAGYSLIKLSHPLDAARIFCQGLNFLHGSSDVGQISDFIVGIFSSANDERNITPNLSSIYKKTVNDHFSSLIWQQVIEKLTRKGLWQSCLLLAAEKDKLPRNLRVTSVSLKDLFEKYVVFGQYERMEKVPILVEWLISIGANIQSIGTYPLHAVMMLCIKSKGSHLFRWLLDHKPELKSLINQQNEDGFTVLHIVASLSKGYSLKKQIDDVVMLLDAGVDPKICDAQSRSAMNILKKNKKFKALDVINKHMARHMLCSEESPGPSDSKATTDSVALLQDAFDQFAQFCLENNVHNIRMKHEKVQRLLKQLSTVREIPEEIVCDIPPTYASSFTKLLLEKQKWHEVLLLLTRKTTGEMSSGGGLLKNFSLSDLDIVTVLNRMERSDKQQIQLIKCLLERGASPEGIGTVHEKPLEKCLKNNEFELAYLLLSSGADPRCMSIVEGDTPLHAALSICFDKKDDIGVHFLRYLLELYDSNPPAFPHLNPNSQDKNGNTIMHILFQKNLTKQVKKMLVLLAKFDINLNLRNNTGKDVCHKKKKTDPILRAWNEAVNDNKKKTRHVAGEQLPKIPKQTPSSNKSQPESLADSSSPPLSKMSTGNDKKPETGSVSHMQKLIEDTVTKNSACRDVNKPLTLRDCLVQEIIQLIQKLSLWEVSAKMNSSTPEVQNSSSSTMKAKEGDHQQVCGHKELICNSREDVFLNKDSSNEKDDNELEELKGEEEASSEDDEPFQDMETSTPEFDKMTWEIECTPEVLKKLANKRMPHYMRNKVIYAVQQLGNGEWTQGLQKQLKHLNSGIQLYEAKLGKGARMLWELAIDFSPRCSETAEKIMESEDSAHPAGSVYTQIIRIWDIVLDHCKLNKAIYHAASICAAYNRGRSCILRKNLKVINTNLLSSNIKIQKRIPHIYVEDTKVDKSEDHAVPEYFPPASAAETEYNIMKFHSFSTNMAYNILNDMTSTVEYPFRVGELEYAIIDLNPKPLEPIILIGRSGTGKTTCCLYRLWKKFHSYWERTELNQDPLLVRQVWRSQKFYTQLENEGSEEKGLDEKQDVCDSSDSAELEMSASIDNEQEEEEDDQCSSGLGDSEINSLCDCDEDEEHTTEEYDKLEHLHQIFVTKNHVLSREVQRNFIELSKSSKVTSHYKPLEPNVYRLQDVKDENFPLFLTSRQLLLLLDASMPDPFFFRNEDGSLTHSIDGWSTTEDTIISNWQEENEDVDVEVDYYDEDEEAAEIHTRPSDSRVFVTYNVFANEIWPKMTKGKCAYNPALVWKEIKSFLKGSFEALSSPQGILTEEEYKKLGRKRCPNFKEDRSEIYQLFCLYQRIRSQGNYFDEEDVLYKLSQRLSTFRVLPWCIHELYADEIQDFTQGELVLLMKCIDNPNAMFLTGDTAQSIMKGVAFRFSDLRSLFHYASKSSNDKKQCIVRKPRRIYQLHQNYRSHSGILHLASGVVDLLQYYFPESFDSLPRDTGLFDGPKPTVLESCSVSDLAILLRGNKRKTQPIEFGAHQVILVANETAKEKIPEELDLALVLTIYEAKGLEFDDVLLYNFFTDSEAYKEWKIISSFIPSSYLPKETKMITETPLEEVDDTQRKHPLLNPEMYKMLNGELKQLYTAITRARVNLWIFDENSERRAPAFQYFIKQELVHVVRTNEVLDDTLFVKTSTPEEWVAQGEYYAKHQCWKVAAKCYQKGGATEKEKLALANDAVLQVQSKKISPKEKQMEYMDLAKTYLEYGEPNLALKCLFHAKEHQLCAQLCEKLGKVKEAAYFYKRGQCYRDAYRCFDQIQEFDLALNMCCQEELYEEAAKCVERYEKILQQEKQPVSKLSYTANQFYLEAAAKYLHANKSSAMMEMLSHLDTEDQLFFLKEHKRFCEAADLLKKEGREEEAAKLMKQHGYVLEAARLTNQMDFRASCLLAAARRGVLGCYSLENLPAILEEALILCEETNQKSGSAEATYLKGVLRKDFCTLKEAFHMYLRVNHIAGAVEALFEAACCEGDSEAFLKLTSQGTEALLKLVKAFQKADTNAEREMVKSCFEYFGIVQIDKTICQISQNEAGYLLGYFPESLNLRGKKSDHFTASLEEVKSVLNKHLLERLTTIVHHLLDLNFPSICSKFISGLKCEDKICKDFHRVLSHPELKSVFQHKMHLAAINGLLLEAKQVFPKDLLHEPNVIDELLTADKYALCRSLVNAIFPKHFHLRMISENPWACKNILSLQSSGYVTSNSCRKVLKEYVRSEFKNETPQNRRESTDLLLKTMQVLALTSHYPEEFERLLYREEDDYKRELTMPEKRPRGQNRGVEGRFGMLLPDKYAGNAESTHLCFIRLLQGSMDQLYIHRNPEKCKWMFYRFMNVLVKKCTIPLIPSIGNTVTLLEFQFILGCAVLMRLCRSMTLCLPKSYIALFHYWDFLFTRGERQKEVFTIIQDYKPQDTKRAIQEFKFHLRYLADVLCKYEKFNVLQDAFDDPDSLISGEAERTVVLCLVMFVNADQLLGWQYKSILSDLFPVLRESLVQMKKEYPSKVPERLFKIVDLMCTASDVKEVVEGLKELLFCRDEEFLADCCWRWGSRYGDNKGVRGIYYKIADLDRFAYVSQAAYWEEPEPDLEKNIYFEEREDPLDDIASIRQQKQQQKASAKRRLRYLFLFVRCCIRWKRVSCSKSGSLEMTLGIFKKADIDKTQCDLCGVKFGQSSVNFPPEIEHLEKEPTETVQTELEWEESLERHENFVASETFENHIILAEHENKSISYQKYFEFFRSKIEPLINNGNNVMEKIVENTCIRGHFTANEHSKLVQRRIEAGIQRITDTVEDIYKRKAWIDAEEIMSKLASELESNVERAVKWLEKMESSLLKEEESDFDKDLNGEVRDEEVTFEELQPKEPSKKGRKRGRRK
ncbi:TPR and ankyrin repeat-containing protein 1 isoform X2 [Sceloporus undulatus]|nr:TPR and ankyrin repeat-containing protein 1 isoform X2 [Sceloporus undulatus]XP_042328666.1 TPR and ankyrin repeat-containing protein 1 isoform X2 [Sceloporus undulatus]